MKSDWLLMCVDTSAITVFFGSYAWLLIRSITMKFSQLRYSMFMATRAQTANQMWVVALCLTP